MSDVRLVLRFGGSSLSSPLRVRGAAERIRFHTGEGAWVAAVVSAPSQESFRIARWLERVSGERLPPQRELRGQEASFGADFARETPE